MSFCENSKLTFRSDTTKQGTIFILRHGCLLVLQDSSVWIWPACPSVQSLLCFVGWHVLWGTNCFYRPHVTQENYWRGLRSLARRRSLGSFAWRAKRVSTREATDLRSLLPINMWPYANMTTDAWRSCRGQLADILSRRCCFYFKNITPRKLCLFQLGLNCRRRRLNLGSTTDCQFSRIYELIPYFTD